MKIHSKVNLKANDKYKISKEEIRIQVWILNVKDLQSEKKRNKSKVNVHYNEKSLYNLIFHIRYLL